MDRLWPPSAKWKEDDVSYKSYSNKERMDFSVARAMNYLTDPDKQKRLKEGYCPCCYYSGGKMAGQAFTQWNCRACLKTQPEWPNTATPLVCKKCSEKHKICVECGADIFLRVRRNNVILLEDSK